MKSLLTILLMSLLLPTSHAQKGLSLSGNFMVLNSSIISQDTWGNGHEYEYEVTITTSYGLDIGYNISDEFGIYTGYWFTDLGQKYSDHYDGSDWERSVKLKYNMIPVMVKFNGTKNKVNFLGGAGVLIANLNKADQEWLRDGVQYMQIIDNPITGEDFTLGATDITERFNKNDILMNFEVGARILLADRLHIDAVLNFAYGLEDINHPDWQIPDNDGTYDPSHNALAGVKVSVAYVLFGD